MLITTADIAIGTAIRKQIEIPIEKTRKDKNVLPEIYRFKVGINNQVGELRKVMSVWQQLGYYHHSTFR